MIRLSKSLLVNQAQALKDQLWPSEQETGASLYDPVAVLNHRTQKKKTAKVVIVGAGIGGITMAWLLEQRGYQDITILEADSRIGGKVLSYTYDGTVHELGACYTQPAYHSIHALLNRYGLTDQEGVAGRVVHRDETPPTEFGDDVIAQVRKAMGGIWKSLPRMAVGLRILLELQNYKQLHRKTLGNYSGQLPPRPDPDVLQNLSVPFIEWLQINKLDALIPVFRLFQSAQGYGYLETVPAFYGLMWNTPEVIDIATEQMSGRGQGATLVRAGLSRLLERMVEEMNTTIHTEMRVSQVIREDGVTIEAHNAEDEIQTFHADQVFVTVPHKDAIKWISNPTQLEEDLFSSLVNSRMTTTLQSSIQPTQDKIDSWFDNIVPGRDHHVITQRCSLAFTDPERFSQITKGTALDRVVYQYGEEPVENEDIEKHYLEHQERIPSSIHTVMSRNHWLSYFPHWEAEGIRLGNPWRLFNAQGQNNTWWIGASACFESINDVVEYNLRLCHDYIDVNGFKSPGGSNKP